MCGLVWMAGQDSAQSVPEALKRLQYRGYDSFGFASLLDVGIESYRSLDDLREYEPDLPASQMVLGHTRWATHGGVSLDNCHPHMDPKQRFALAHNGIVENFTELQAEVGSDVTSDTALLMLCLGQALDAGLEQREAFSAMVTQIRGRNALVVMFANGEVWAYRHGSPLMLVQLESGLGIGSDLPAFADQVRACCPLEDQEIARFSGSDLLVYGGANQLSEEGRSPAWQPVEPFDETYGEQPSHFGAGGYMYREVFEQWRTLSLPIPDTQQQKVLTQLVASRSLILVTGAGGAGLVAEQIAHLLVTRGNCRALAVPVGEIDSYRAFADESLLLAISQSGETADTLCVISRVQSWGVPVMSLVNAPYSSMGRCSELAIEMGIGPEHCVLSTKSATAQIGFGYWLAGFIADGATRFKQELNGLGSALAQQLNHDVLEYYTEVVNYLVQQQSLFLLGRGDYLAAAKLGALNLKEASYIHAEAFSAGELKHGVIALIEPGTPVILFDLESDPYMNGVMAELKCRGAKVITVGSNQGDLSLPEFAGGHPATSPISCQILAYMLALAKGIDPDRPRNLAKSVTVL